MVYYAAMFFLLAVLAGVLGFTGIAATLASLGKILFYIFITLFFLAIIGSIFVDNKKPTQTGK